MSVKRRCSTRWGHPYHLQGACTEWRQTLLHPLCSITPMTPEDYTEYFAQSKREDTSEEGLQPCLLGSQALRAKTAIEPQNPANRRRRCGVAPHKDRQMPCVT